MPPSNINKPSLELSHGNSRKWFSALWNNLEWPLVGLLALFSLYLGAKGYATYFGISDKSWINPDYIYLSLQLFVLQNGWQIGTKIPPSLQIASFLSPGIGAYTLLQAFIEIFNRQLNLLRLFVTRNHTVICGLGEKGLLLVRDQLKENQYVVVIEQDGNNPRLEICRELGAFVIIGDARDRVTLYKAGVKRAKYLFVVCGEDGKNVEVAEQAQRYITNRKAVPLTCILHINDNYLWTLLREKMFMKEQLVPFRTELFNVYDTGARILLRETLQNYIGQPHILIIGLGELAEHIILRAAQKRCLSEEKSQLLVSVIDPDVNPKLESIKIRYPILNKACQFFPHKYQTNWPEFQTGAFLNTSKSGIPITHAFICFDDTTLGLQAGFVLLRLLQNQKTQIMVRMTEDAGLATFLKEINNTNFENLSAFGLLDRACGTGLFDDGAHEDLARIIHGDYLARETAKEPATKGNPNLVAWENLSYDIKESNRRQADHIGHKLNAINYGITPWIEYGREKFSFSPEEIEVMARMEHKRWCEEKEKDGWKYGDIRDDKNRIHPDLILHWEDPRLTEETKDKDRDAVKLIPELLARAGFQIYRIHNR